MKEWMIAVTKDYVGEEYEFPDIYRVYSDSPEDAADVLETMYKNYLETEVQETAIPIDHRRTYYTAEAGYAQIAWKNGDIHRYFLADVKDARQYLDSKGSGQGKEATA